MRRTLTIHVGRFHYGQPDQTMTPSDEHGTCVLVFTEHFGQSARYLASCGCPEVPCPNTTTLNIAMLVTADLLLLLVASLFALGVGRRARARSTPQQGAHYG